jgi:mycothiol synthase
MTTLIPHEQQLTLPPGYTTRPVRIEDVDMLARFFVEAQQVSGYGEIVTPDLLRDEWTTPDFNLEKSTCLVLAADGTPAALMIVWDRVNPPVHPWLQWEVHPAHDRESLSRWLLWWGEERAKQALDRCPPEARVSLRGEARSGFLPVESLYREYGYSTIRHFYRMRIDMTEAPAVPPLPDGFTLRTYQHPEDLIAIIQTRVDAFRDHFGFIERPMEEMLPDWEHVIASDKLFDPSLWHVALDAASGQIAGFVISRIEDFDDPEVAYVDVIGVRKEYRKRGLASFLLRHSFAEFWKRGRTTTALHLDAQNTTGALRVYQSVGMHVERDYTAWEKELRSGVELTNLAESSD